jgi:hypothetical protein
MTPDWGRLVYRPLRGEEITDLVSFLDVAGTEAAVILVGADDEFGLTSRI